MKHVARDIASAEITRLVLFVASEEASFSTGSEFIADGATCSARCRTPARYRETANHNQSFTTAIQNSLFCVDGLFDLASVLMGGKLPEPRNGELPIRAYLPGSAARAKFRPRLPVRRH